MNRETIPMEDTMTTPTPAPAGGEAERELEALAQQIADISCAEMWSSPCTGTLENKLAYQAALAALRTRPTDDLAVAVEALREAAATLDWAARRMKGVCSGSDVNAVMLAAGRATEVRAALYKLTGGEA